jgi:hypothetical protein
MEKREYFKNLVTLFEASQKEKDQDKKLSEALPEEKQVVSQEEMNNDDLNSAGNIEEKPELDDADYLSYDEMTPGLSPIDDLAQVSEQKKMVKLFGLYRELLNYSTVFYDSLDIIDMNLLDGEKFRQLKENKRTILEVSEKLRSYITDTFVNEKYERALYVYILLRTELVTVIKLLRESLGLNKQTDEKQEKKENGFK